MKEYKIDLDKSFNNIALDLTEEIKTNTSYLLEKYQNPYSLFLELEKFLNKKISQTGNNYTFFYITIDNKNFGFQSIHKKGVFDKIIFIQLEFNLPIPRYSWDKKDKKLIKNYTEIKKVFITDKKLKMSEIDISYWFEHEYEISLINYLYETIESSFYKLMLYISNKENCFPDELSYIELDTFDNRKLAEKKIKEYVKTTYFFLVNYNFEILKKLIK